MTNELPAREIRAALRESMRDHTPPASESPIPFTYMPSSHARALDPNSVLVEGMRGAGKSWWWKALVDNDHRKFVSDAFPEAGLTNRITVKAGFGIGLATDFPSKDTLKTLLNRFTPRNIWRAVLAHNLEFPPPYPQGTNRWPERIKWVEEHQEEYDTLLNELDKKYTSDNNFFILLFDALDLLADDWPAIRPLAKALFQLALDVRYCRAIRFKLFVRPDMIEDDVIFAFPDSSKLKTQKASLEWRKVDLYALMFQCLGNNPGHGELIRDRIEGKFGVKWERGPQSIWLVPTQLRTDEEKQKEIFHAITGPYMGPGQSGYKRGFPYSWLANHLGDANEQISPRTFAAAIKNAAESTLEEDAYSINYNAIKKGVQASSRIRRDEVTEDYPWVGDALEPLKGLVVPCDRNDIFDKWKSNDTVSRMIKKQYEKLSPQHIDSGDEGLLQDLLKLKLIQEMSGSRIQMPDVYRIAFGLGRKGGVKPVK